MTHVEVPGSATRSIDRMRWFSCVNVERSETIPGFALMCLHPEDNDEFFTQRKKAGMAQWEVHKATADDESRQNPALLMINGPRPIPPGQPGQGTFDFPAQVLHNGRVDNLPNGRPCGPKADCWEVYSGEARTAFTCVSHDACRAEPGTSDGIHTVWIREGVRPNVNRGALTKTFQLVASGGIIKPETEWMRVGLTWDENKFGWTVEPKALTLWLSVAATLMSEVNSEGAILAMGVYVNSTPTYLSGWRRQGLDWTRPDDHGYRWTQPFFTAENVAFAGPLALQRGDVVTVRNTGYLATAYYNFIFSAFQLAVGLGAQTGTLTYP